MGEAMEARYPLTSFLENRSYDVAVAIYEQRIKDALHLAEEYREVFLYRDCPVCGASEASEGVPFHDSYNVMICMRCQTHYVNPAPPPEALAYYYNHCDCNSMLAQLYRERAKDSENYVLNERTQYVLQLLDEFPDERELAILEVGCSSGAFLANLRRAADDLLPHRRLAFYGIDVDADAVAQSVDSSLNIRAMPVERLAADSGIRFDLVLHFELIEHLPDPFAFMRLAHDLLVDDGIHLLHTPNSVGFENIACDYNSLRLIAHAIFPPMHLNGFNTRNFTHFALRSGYDVVLIDTPGKLDVDIVRLCREHVSEERPYRHLDMLDEDQLGLLQAIVTDLGASSHMRCVLRRRSDGQAIVPSV